MTPSYDRDLLLLELGDLNEKLVEARGTEAYASLVAEREALIARIQKPVQISITATVR